MKVISGKDPIFETDNYEVILVSTSIYNILCNGFQGKMANKYAYIVEENNKQQYADTRRLGTRLTIKRNGLPTISLLYVCRCPQKGLKSLDYSALKKCLDTAALEFKGKRVLSTVLGASVFDGEGSKKRILRMMEKAFEDVDVDVYDYKQLALNEETKIKRRQFAEMGITDKKKCIEILKQLYLIPEDAKK